MKKLTSLKAFALASIITTFSSSTFTSCNGLSDIGNSIVQDSITIVVDSAYTITGMSVADPSVMSRTIMQLLGSVDAEGYGAISSDFVTQFMPSIALDTVGVRPSDVDSIKLIMQINSGNIVGDSLAPMGLEVYPLTKALSSPIFSDFNPDGYYDPNRKLGSLIYNTSAVGQSDSIANLKYRTLYVDMPRQMGVDLLDEYIKNPAAFSSPTAFAAVFPGIYVKNSYGTGRITRISQTLLRMYYHRHITKDDGSDSLVYKIGNYFAVTPEIVANNNIKLNIAPSIRQSVAAGDAIMLAPAGLNVEFNFPTDQIISRYKSNLSNIGVINALSLELPVEEIENDCNITPPPHILMILKKDKEQFFLDNKMTDDITSFYAAYNSYSKSYSFSGMREYLISMMKKDKLEADDMTFVLVPVTVNTETNTDYYGGTTSYATSIVPYVTEPKMAKFLFNKAKIRFTYSKQTINF